MIVRNFKLVLGVLLLPFCFYLTVSLYKQLDGIETLLPNQVYFLIGAVSYLILHSLFLKPMRIYVFGHEFMHAIPVWFFGGKVKGFKVSKEGGSVEATKSNFIISLFPYFIPTYTVFLFVAFLLISLFYNLSQYMHYFVFLIAFTLAFHITMTVDFLKTKQPDLVKTGYLFSFSLIYIINICVVVLILMFVFKEKLSFIEFIKTAYYLTRDFYVAAFKQLFIIGKS